LTKSVNRNRRTRPKSSCSGRWVLKLEGCCEDAAPSGSIAEKAAARSLIGAAHTDWVKSASAPRLCSSPLPGSGWWHAVYRWGRGSPWGHAAVSRSGASCLRGNFRTNGPGARPTKSWPTNPPTTSEIQLSWQKEIYELQSNTNKGEDPKGFQFASQCSKPQSARLPNACIHPCVIAYALSDLPL